jgi:hypothetical protein
MVLGSSGYMSGSGKTARTVMHSWVHKELYVKLFLDSGKGLLNTAVCLTGRCFVKLHFREYWFFHQSTFSCITSITTFTVLQRFLIIAKLKLTLFYLCLFRYFFFLTAVFNEAFAVCHVRQKSVPLTAV